MTGAARDVRNRAAAGAVMIGLRGMGVRVIGLLGNVVLARLLLPKDFGLIAFAASVTFFASTLSDAGIGAGLIRRQQPPTHDELRATSGFQILVSTTFALCVAIIAIPIGRPGQVAALMVASLPLVGFRMPGALLLERELNYRPLIAVELTETLAFNAFAILTVALGAGVWGLAGAATFRTLVGAVCMVAISPVGLVVPRFRFGAIRTLLGFGAQFQAVGFLLVARGLILSAGVAATGGLTVLGLWAIADRFLSVLTVLVESLWRVSFPMISRLIDAGEDTRPLVVRNFALVTLAIALIASGLTGASRGLIPLLLGSSYADAVEALIPAAFSLVLSVPAGVVIAGYLFARGRAGAVLLPTLAHTLLWFAVAFPLAPPLGVGAVGIGSLVGGAAGAALLIRAVDIPSREILAPAWRPVAGSLAAGAAGALATDLFAADATKACAGGVVGIVAFLAMMLVMDRPLVARARTLLCLALTQARRGSAAAGEAV
jgi:polysaccharide transporter, PST family